jgi:hypothetical protein
MTMKRLAIIAVLPLTVAVILGVLAMLPPRPGVTKANFDRIEIGMTQEDVEAILGSSELHHRGGLLSGRTAIRWNSWVGADGATVDITFLNYAVERSTWTESKETLTDKIRRWLNLK